MFSKSVGTHLRAIALLTLVMLPLAAQPPGGGRPGGRPGASGPDAQEHHEFMAGYLGLTDNQKEQVKQAFSDLQGASASLRGQMGSAQVDLQTAIKANAPGSHIDQLAAAIGLLHGQGVAAQSKARAKFYSLLTEEQRKKLESFERNTDGRGQRP